MLGPVARLLAVLLASVVVLALVAPRNSWFVLPVVVVWATTATLLLGWLVGRPLARRWAPRVRRRPWAVLLAGTLSGTALAALQAWLALIPFGWDARGVFDGATRIAASTPFTEVDWEYFARYPNNIPLASLESLVIGGGAVVGLSPTASVVTAQVVGFGILLWCLGSTLMILGRHGAVLPVQGLATVLLGLHANLAVPYSDFPVATLVAVTVWAAVRGWSGRGWSWWIVAFASVVLATSLKAYAVALVIGLLALLPALAGRIGRLRSVLVVGAVTVGLAVGVVAVHDTAQRATGLTEDRLARYDPGIPPMHFLAMGTHDSKSDSPTRRYGGWSGDHVARTRAEKDPEAREQMLRETVMRQVSERGLLDNGRFFALKVGWTWGDGTFWAHGEGPDSTKEPRLSGAAGQAQQWVIGSGEPYREWTAGVRQGVWLFALLAAATVAWRRHRDTWVQVCCLSLVTLMGYLMLFESRPRYLIALLPVLLVLTGLGRPATTPRRPGRLTGSTPTA